mmetsp:Transcript_23579/g.58277  ORF Transcript_23579/g.58277 Transcript_23579/m.58277 type:complete len:258 (-) Transcript_23579:14-787(-)
MAPPPVGLGELLLWPDRQGNGGAEGEAIRPGPSPDREGNGGAWGEAIRAGPSAPGDPAGGRGGSASKMEPLRVKLRPLGWLAGLKVCTGESGERRRITLRAEGLSDVSRRLSVVTPLPRLIPDIPRVRFPSSAGPKSGTPWLAADDDAAAAAAPPAWTAGRTSSNVGTPNPPIVSSSSALEAACCAAATSVTVVFLATPTSSAVSTSILAELLPAAAEGSSCSAEADMSAIALQTIHFFYLYLYDVFTNKNALSCRD